MLSLTDIITAQFQTSNLSNTEKIKANIKSHYNENLSCCFSIIKENPNTCIRETAMTESLARLMLID